MFDRISDFHIALGHAGRDNLAAETGNKYFNISNKLINVYLATCATCDERRNRPPKGVVVKPILTEDFNSRVQVDYLLIRKGWELLVCDGIFSYRTHAATPISRD